MTMTTSNDDAVDVDVLPVFDILNMNDNINNNDEDENEDEYNRSLLLTMLHNNYHISNRRNNNKNNRNNKDDDNDGRLLLTMLPLPLLSLIINIVGTQEDLTNISVLSKQFYMIVHLPAIETKIIRIYEISPSKNNNRGSNRKLLQRLVHNRVNNNEKFSQYHHFRLNIINEFDDDLTDVDVDNITNNVPSINNFESLDLSLSPYSSSTLRADGHILCAMKDLLSNVQEINLSCVRFDKNFQPQRYLRNFFNSLASLQKVTWNHCDRDMNLSGCPLYSTRTKEIVSDNSLFIVSQGDLERMPNLEQHDDIFMFCCCKSLECLSIRNAKYTHPLFADSDGDVVLMDIPQNMLIKFVRYAPLSMRWFRSDLTKENMVMLEQERPEIQLLN